MTFNPADSFVTLAARDKEIKRMVSIARKAVDDALDSDESVRNGSRFDITWFDDIEEQLPKSYVLQDVLGEGEFSVLVGLPGTGKSVIATDIAAHVAAGKDWHGRPVRKGLVVYVAAERRALTERRLAAFRAFHGVADVPLAVVSGRLDMTADLADARDLATAVRHLEEESGEDCVLIVIDTLTRVFGGGDQNASKDMGRFVQAVDELGRLTNAHILVIHHSPWNEKRGKGAIDLDGAVDLSLFVKKEGDVCSLSCDGSNDGEEGELLRFRMQGVEVGRTDDGKATEAPVVVPATGNLAGRVHPPAERKASVSEVALAALAEAVDRDGMDAVGAHFPAGVTRVVTEDAWRAAFYDTMPDEVMQDTRKKRFQRATRKLIEAGDVCKIGQCCWPAQR